MRNEHISPFKFATQPPNRHQHLFVDAPLEANEPMIPK
jgi:hypothetical protein